MTNIVHFPCANNDIVEHLEFLLNQARSGEIVGFAAIDVRPGGIVGTAFYGAAGTYHYLNSGAARLAQRIASEPGDA